VRRQVADGRGADHRAEALGEARARHGGLARQGLQAPVALRRAVQRGQRAADGRVAQAAQPALAVRRGAGQVLAQQVDRQQLAHACRRDAPAGPAREAVLGQRLHRRSQARQPGHLGRAQVDQRRQLLQHGVAAPGREPQQHGVHLRRLARAAVAEDQRVLVARALRMARDQLGEGRGRQARRRRELMGAAQRQHEQVAGLHLHRGGAVQQQPPRCAAREAQHHAGQPVGAQRPGRVQREARRHRALDAAGGQHLAQRVHAAQGGTNRAFLRTHGG